MLKAVARAELRSLGVQLRKTKPGESVHGARRQIKRLRSLLRLLREPMGEEAFQAANGALRDAADALASRRRAEALVAAAGRIGGGGRAQAPWMLLAGSHRDSVTTGSAPDGGLNAARSAVQAAAKSISGAKLKPDSALAIGDAFLATYKKARKWLKRGLDGGSAEDMHTARKHVIHHLHHLDLLGDHLKHAGRRVAALEKLREALGDLNDLDELHQLASQAEPLPELARKAMAKRRSVLLKRAEKAAERLFRHKPKAFRKRIGAMWPMA
jgi:CHAD domain-containing protein